MKLLPVLLLFISHCLIAQNIEFKGVISDEYGLEIKNVQIINTETQQTTFSNIEGSFSISINKNKVYTFLFSAEGFKEQELTITVANTSIYKEIILLPSELNDVVATASPIIYKEDTVTYKLDAFSDQTERSVKDLIKKIPGIEVDKNGNITANGKPIEKVTIENNDIFGGNTKLTTESLPADAFDKLEVISNYSESDLLKDAGSSQKSIINLKLKEGKKNVWFGNQDVSAGYKERYLLNAKLFNISEKKNIVLLGNLNNVGKPTLSMEDWLSFNGGIGVLLEDIEAFFTSESFAEIQFLLNNKGYKTNEKFLGVNFLRNLNKYTEISGYSLFQKNNISTQNNTINTYLEDGNVLFDETKNSLSDNTRLALISNIKLKKKKNNQELNYSFYNKVTDLSIDNTNDFTIVDTNNFNQNNNFKAFKLSQNVEYINQFNKKNTFIANLYHSYYQSKNKDQYYANTNIFNPLLQLDAGLDSNLFASNFTQEHQLNSKLKYIYKINSKNNLIATLSNKLITSINHSENFQNQNNNALFAGQDNVLEYNSFFTIMDFNLAYRKLMGKVDLTLGTSINSTIKNLNLVSKNRIENKYILPFIKFNINFKTSEKLIFNYALKTKTPDYLLHYNTYKLLNFSSVNYGNDNLENNLFHFAYAHYFRHIKLYDISYNLNASYSHYLKNMAYNQNQTLNYFYNIPILVDNQSSNYSVGLGIDKKIGKINLNYDFDYNRSKNKTVLNDNFDGNFSDQINTSLNFTSFFKEKVNFNVGLEYSQIISKSNEFRRKYTTYIINSEVDFNLYKKWKLYLDYNFSSQKSNNSQNTFNNLNIKLNNYHQENKFNIEFEVYNLFNQEFKENFTFNNTIISLSKDYILPRMFLVSITFAL